MAFGQQTGPPASARQVEELSLLLGQAGYASFREARHLFGLTQRQAAGRFTRSEAVGLIDRLRGEADEGRPVPVPVVDADRVARRHADRQAEALAAMPGEDLADELVRRGWMCMPPT